MMDDVCSNVMMEMLQPTIHAVDGFKIATNVIPRSGVVPSGAGLCVV